ncbi:uncharacterized protein DEA37_0015010 [Paragonimus westermani]|uniref:G-protein coupled receptors family 1 profile domain-containing protein n=1 Tax=Paragonimus westermani TaxID=34504 RepID=A0A5J4NV70_9TREM|nr:uncharacterized protein DEA37_0015010 [Paragonimus westermani]
MDNHTIEEISKPVAVVMCVYSYFLLAMGTSGNILLLLTLLFKKHHRRKPVPEIIPRHANLYPSCRVVSGNASDRLLMLLTTSDLCCLWVLVLRYLIILTSGGDIRTVSDSFCKIHTFSSMVCSNLSIALLCIFSVHRTIGIQWPLVSHTWLTKKRLNTYLVFALMIILLKHTSVLFLFQLSEIGQRKKCDLNDQWPTLGKVYYNIEFSTHCCLGYSVLIISNICLFVALKRKTRKNLVTTSRDKSGPNDATHKGINTARTLLFFTIIQLLTSVPFLVVIEFNDQLNLQMVPEQHKLTVYFGLLLAMFTNNAINYFLMIGISKTFMNEARDYFIHLKKLC